MGWSGGTQYVSVQIVLLDEEFEEDIKFIVDVIPGLVHSGLKEMHTTCAGPPHERALEDKGCVHSQVGLI